MKNKLLLNSACLLALSAISTQSLSAPKKPFGTIAQLQNELNYPEHIHYEGDHVDAMMQLIDKIGPLYNLSIDYLENKQTLPNSTFVDEHPIFLSEYPHYQDSLYGTDLSTNATSSTMPSHPNIFSSHPPAMSNTSPLQEKFDHLNNAVRDNSYSLSLVNSAIHNLDEHIKKIDNQYLNDNQDTIKSINTLKNTLSSLEQKIKESEDKSKHYINHELFEHEESFRDYSEQIEKNKREDMQKINDSFDALRKEIKDSDELTNLLIKDVEKSSKAHAELILNNQKMENTERVNKLDKQSNLHTKQFKKVDAKFEHLESKINQTARNANAGIASVAAMTNIPYSTGTRFSAGLGAGNFKNGKAIAAGAQYQIKQNLNVRSSISWNNSDSAVIGAGIAYGW